MPKKLKGPKWRDVIGVTSRFDYETNGGLCHILMVYINCTGENSVLRVIDADTNKLIHSVPADSIAAGLIVSHPALKFVGYENYTWLVRRGSEISMTPVEPTLRQRKPK